MKKNQMQISASSKYISGLPIRELLTQLQLSPTDADTQVAQSAFLGLSEKTIAIRKDSHLTYSTDVDHQIRFPLKSRVERNIKKLAAICAPQLKRMNIHTIQLTLNPQDYLSNFFVSELKKYSLVIIHKDISFQNQSTNQIHSEIEQIIETIFSSNIPPRTELLEMRPQLNQYLRERMYCGDYQTPRLVLEKIPVEDRCEVQNQLLGLACNFFGETEQSEVHFMNMLANDSILAKINAYYTLAMLYLRLHPKQKQDVAIAEEYLNKGYSIIKQNPQIQNHSFQLVFNRNGFALCLFRRGKAQEALDLLDEGMLKLNSKANTAHTVTDGARELHCSVLLYNSIQCLRALKNYEECEKRCHQLLQLDPLFPEYWLELSSILIEQEKFESALDILAKAEQLDNQIPEIFALKAYSYLQLHSLEKAIQNYSQAIELDSENETFKNDLAYCLEISA